MIDDQDYKKSKIQTVSQNALKKPAMTQFAMNWGLLAGALLIGSLTLWSIKDTANAINQGSKEDFDETGDIEASGVDMYDPQS